jgi:hypothetical protein
MIFTTEDPGLGNDMASEYMYSTTYGYQFTGVVYSGAPGSIASLGIQELAGLLAHEWAHQFLGSVDEDVANAQQDQCLGSSG